MTYVAHTVNHTLNGSLDVGKPALSIFNLAYNVVHNRVVAFIWLIGMFLSIFYHVLTYRAFINKIKQNSITVTDNQALKVLQESCTKINITSNIKLLTCTKLYSPILVGLFQPMIIIPDTVLEDKRADLELIMTHELTHYKNMDILYKHFILLVKVIHWFNPLAYLVANMANESCDYACDYTIIKQMDYQFSLRYAYMLLNTMQLYVMRHQLPLNCLVTHLFRNKRNTKRRFELIMMKNKKKKLGITFALIAILGVSVYTTVMAAVALSDAGFIAQKPNAVVLPMEQNIAEYQEPEITFDEKHVKISLGELTDNGDGSYNVTTEDGKEIRITFPNKTGVLMLTVNTGYK